MKSKVLEGKVKASDFLTCEVCGKDSAKPVPLYRNYAYCKECDHVTKL